jgi:hypothetical protein
VILTRRSCPDQAATQSPLELATVDETGQGIVPRLVFQCLCELVVVGDVPGA